MQDPRIKKVKSDYNGFIVYWNNHIKEKIQIARRYYGKKIRSKKKHFLLVVPEVWWWDKLSNDKIVARHFKYNINELELNNSDEYFNLSKWSYQDFETLKFYDKLMFMHGLLDFIVEHGWKPFKYPDEVLRENYQNILNEGTNSHRRRNGYRLAKYFFKNKDRPGDLILEHFMPNGHYNLSNNKFIYNFKHKNTICRWYKAIRRIIRKNKWFKKEEINKTIDFDYKTLIKAIKVSDRRQKFFKSFKFRPIALYRVIIKDLGLSGKTFFDFEPRYGEKFLAAVVEECPYYFRPTCPFDTYYKDVAKFIEYDDISEEDKSIRYDFSIIDFDFKFNKSVFDYYMKNYFNKIDVNVIFVSNPYVEEIMKKYPPTKKIPMRICHFEPLNGYFFIYN